MFMKPAFACLLLFVTSACSAVSDAGLPAAAPVTGAETSAALRGKEFAQAHCAACHSIDSGISPVSAAPSFAAIANSQGLNADTLRPWLLNSHNYPDMMNFALTPAQSNDLTYYMLTLKQPDYRPPIQ